MNIAELDKCIGKKLLKVRCVPLIDTPDNSIYGTFQSEINLKFSFWHDWIVVKPEFIDPNDKESLIKLKIFYSRKAYNQLAMRMNGSRLKTQDYKPSYLGKFLDYNFESITEFPNETEQSESLKLIFELGEINLSAEMPVPFMQMRK